MTSVETINHITQIGNSLESDLNHIRKKVLENNQWREREIINYYMRYGLVPKEILERDGFEFDDIVLGYHWCQDNDKSHMGVSNQIKTFNCIYDSIEDPCHDCCLICGQPQERK